MLWMTPYLFHDQKTIINVYPLNTTTEPQKVMHVTPTLSTLLEKNRKKWPSIVLTFHFPLKISTINKKWSDAGQNRDQIGVISQSYSRDNKYYILAIQRNSQRKLPRHCVCQKFFFLFFFFHQWYQLSLRSRLLLWCKSTVQEYRWRVPILALWDTGE